MGFSRSHTGSTVCRLITQWEPLIAARMGSLGPGAPCKIPVQNWTTSGETPLAPALIRHPGPSYFAPCLIQQPSQACLGHMILFQHWADQFKFLWVPRMGCCGRAPIEKIVFWEEKHFFSFVLFNSISKCLIQAKFRHKIRALGGGRDFQH